MRSAFHLKTRMPPLNTYENRGIHAPLTNHHALTRKIGPDGATIRSKAAIRKQGRKPFVCHFNPLLLVRVNESEDGGKSCPPFGFDAAVSHGIIQLRKLRNFSQSVPGGETWLMLADGRRGSRDAVLLHSISQIGPQEPLRDSEALLPQTFFDEFV